MLVRYRITLPAAALVSLVVLISVGNVPSLAAQSAWGTGHRLGIGTGVIMHRSVDEVASPLTYGGVHFPARLSYEHVGGESRHSMVADFMSGELAALTGDGPVLNVDNLRGSLRYGYYRSAHSSAATRFLLGGEISTTAALRGYPHGNDSWEGYFSLDLSGVSEHAFDARQRVTGRASVPLVAYAMRPSYSLESDEVYRAYYETSRFVTDLGRVSSWNSRYQIRLQVAYERRLSDAFDLRLGYTLDLSRYSLPRPTANYLGGFDADMFVNF